MIARDCWLSCKQKRVIGEFLNDQVVSDVLTDYFAEQSEDEILDDIRLGMRHALMGELDAVWFTRSIAPDVDREVTGDAHDR